MQQAFRAVKQSGVVRLWWRGRPRRDRSGWLGRPRMGLRGRTAGKQPRCGSQKRCVPGGLSAAEHWQGPSLPSRSPVRSSIRGHRRRPNRPHAGLPAPHPCTRTRCRSAAPREPQR